MAHALKVSERGLDTLCRNLAANGLIEKHGLRYRNTRFAATELNGSHALYRGAYIDLLKDQWDDWSRLTDAVRTGLPVDHGKREEADYRERFTWAIISARET